MGRWRTPRCTRCTRLLAAGFCGRRSLVPVTMLATHAMYAGPEIMMNLAEEARTFSPTDIRAKTQQVVPDAGDVIWYYQAPNLMAGLTDEVWEVGLFYGSGGRIVRGGCDLSPFNSLPRCGTAWPRLPRRVGEFA